MPLLTSILLHDNGRHALSEKMNELYKIVNEHPITVNSDDETETNEEKFMGSALRSMKLHAKAKLLIMQIIHQIQDESRQSNKTDVPLTEIKTMSEIMTKLSKMLEEEDPVMAAKMGILNLNGSEDDLGGGDLGEESS